MFRAACVRAARPLSKPWRCQNFARQALGNGRSDGRRWVHEVSAAELKFGQPLHETHPHLLKPGELTRGIQAAEYADRRDKLAALMPDDSVALLSSAHMKYRAGPAFYEFHQDPNFFYLTGFNEPESLAVIEKDKSGYANFTLFVREKNETVERWEGSRSGTQAAVDVFNADQTGDSVRVSEKLASLLKSTAHLFTDLTSDETPKHGLQGWLQHRGTDESSGLQVMLKKIMKDQPNPMRVRPLRNLMNSLRLIKSDAEVENMRQAGKISGRAFTEAMRAEWPGEKDLRAFMEYKFRIDDCENEAYVPVVASGENALQIHYTSNNCLIDNDQMILVDAGGQYGNYITDITRTWPNSGKFTTPQKDLYEAVLAVQRTCVSLCREDANMSLDEIHRVATRSLQRSMKDLGFDFGRDNVDVLFPHHLGHHIGLEVHDCAGVPRSDKLRTGMCVTIEPGIYVPHDERWPAHFRGIGIRIEDSVCVEDENPYILTTEAVKEVVDIEALRR